MPLTVKISKCACHRHVCLTSEDYYLKVSMKLFLFTETLKQVALFHLKPQENNREFITQIASFQRFHLILIMSFWSLSYSAKEKLFTAYCCDRGDKIPLRDVFAHFPKSQLCSVSTTHIFFPPQFFLTKKNDGYL